jgi:hypothetical protein
MNESGLPVVIITSTTMVEINLIRRNFVHLAGKINKKITGDAPYNNALVMKSLRGLSSYIAGLTPRLNSNWFMSYVKIGRHGEMTFLTDYKVRNVSIILLYTFVCCC